MPRKKKQGDGGSVKGRPQRGRSAKNIDEASGSDADIDADSGLASSAAPSPVKEQNASVAGVCRALRSAKLNVSADTPGLQSGKRTVKGLEDYQTTLHSVQQISDAIDAEVKLRSQTIRALAAAQFSSWTAQLNLLLSKFTAEEMKMPLKEFLQSCPGIKMVENDDGRIRLIRCPSHYPQFEESKRNLQDVLKKAKGDILKGTNPAFFTPRAGAALPDIEFNASEPENLRHTEFYAREKENQAPEQKLDVDELSWPEYVIRLQSQGYKYGATPSLQNQSKMTTPMTTRCGLMSGPTPKTMRLPKPGETVLSVSINGSPLGQVEQVPGSAGGSRMTRTKSRLASSKRSLRDL